jgi:hypothetical protein
MMKPKAEKMLYKAEKKLTSAMKVDKKADAGVSANLKAAMKHCKEQVKEK